MLAEMFDEIGPEIQAGMSTLDVDKLFHSWMKKHHAGAPCLGYMGYPRATCVSVNDMAIHGIPNAKEILKEGDLVSVDICLEKNGYISDSTRTYEIGTVTPEVHQLNVVTNECLYLGIEAAGKRGARIQDIAKAVQTHAQKYGYGVIRDYCGHGVGLEMHEDPEIPNYVSQANPNPRLREGMVIAIEPMINMGNYRIKTLSDGWGVKTIDGKPACHWEHTVAILKDGVEILTRV